MFLWVGEGEMRAELEAALAATGLASRVTFAGFRTDVRRLLRASDIFVFPTLYEGGCSQALLEAMEEGLPIVVSGIAGVREVVADGDTALLVPPGDGEALIAGDPTSCRRSRLARSPRCRGPLAGRRLLQSCDAF